MEFKKWSTEVYKGLKLVLTYTDVSAYTSEAPKQWRSLPNSSFDPEEWTLFWKTLPQQPLLTLGSHRASRQPYWTGSNMTPC